MSQSNSSLNLFANCMRAYYERYILHTKSCRPISPHLTFGTMAHDVLYKAGLYRDAAADGVITNDEYVTVIPGEPLYLEMKNYFQIHNWRDYFIPVIKQVAEYEKQLISEMNEPVQIFRENKFVLTSEELKTYGIDCKDNLTGVIDLLLLGKNSATIIDYKFSTNRKDQTTFDNDSQLQFYSMYVHLYYDIPLHNIRYGFIDIPKKEFGRPVVLTNGTLSRASSQNTSQDMYKMAVEAIHGEDKYYNCEPGGYYYDCYQKLALNKSAYLSYQYLDVDAYEAITQDLIDATNMITVMKEQGMPFLRKYNSPSCKDCDYLDNCKKWIGSLWS